MKTRKKQTKENITIHISCPNSIGPDEMKDIIAKAIIKADEIRIQKEEERSKDIDKRWHETIGYKDYSNKKGLAKWALRLINDIVILVKIPFIPKAKIETDWISWSLLKTAMVILFQGITLMLFISTIIPVYMAIQQKNFFYISFAFLLYALGGISRMTTIEIDRIRDRNYLIGLFTAIVTVISVIIAVITIIGGK